MPHTTESSPQSWDESLPFGRPNGTCKGFAVSRQAPVHGFGVCVLNLVPQHSLLCEYYMMMCLSLLVVAAGAAESGGGGQWQLIVVKQTQWRQKRSGWLFVRCVDTAAGAEAATAAAAAASGRYGCTTDAVHMHAAIGSSVASVVSMAHSRLAQ